VLWPASIVVDLYLYITDGGSATSHDKIRGTGVFDTALTTTTELAALALTPESSARSTRPTAATR
jgi:hypothetical protein